MTKYLDEATIYLPNSHKLFVLWLSSVYWGFMELMFSLIRFTSLTQRQSNDTKHSRFSKEEIFNVMAFIVLLRSVVFSANNKCIVNYTENNDKIFFKVYLKNSCTKPFGQSCSAMHGAQYQTHYTYRHIL